MNKRPFVMRNCILYIFKSVRLCTEADFSTSKFQLSTSKLYWFGLYALDFSWKASALGLLII